MGDLDELRNRVDKAAGRLSAVNDARRSQSQSLMTRLADLEEKNEALTRENADLAGRVKKLVQIVDDAASSDETYTLFRASAKVSDVVADWLGPEDHDTSEPEARDGRETEDGMEIPQ